MDFSADRQVIDEAYAQGGKDEALRAFYGILCDPEEDWSQARMVSSVFYLQQLERAVA
ncbi:hypothetical protein [Streptomyces olivaceiscleroticus]|uniref:Uncharacterized protein n=1 Tax=Streptomyces olivaceiscleroticus TaxID=68245 RepID=A0ABP3LLB3_9ACTN